MKHEGHDQGKRFNNNIVIHFYVMDEEVHINLCVLGRDSIFYFLLLCIFEVQH